MEGLSSDFCPRQWPPRPLSVRDTGKCWRLAGHDGTPRIKVCQKGRRKGRDSSSLCYRSQLWQLGLKRGSKPSTTGISHRPPHQRQNWARSMWRSIDTPMLLISKVVTIHILFRGSLGPIHMFTYPNLQRTLGDTEWTDIYLILNLSFRRHIFSLSGYML